MRKLGFNKSRVSKIIKKLELRELISIKKEGKVKIIGVGKGLHEKL